MTFRVVPLVAAALLLAACATDPAVPTADGLQVLKDDYDGATIVRQSAVQAGQQGDGEFNALGFEWRSKFPDRVVLVAGTRGVIRVANLVLEVDGEPLNVKTVGETTSYGDPAAGPRWSMRRFEVSWPEFQKLVAAKSVRMKVVGPNEMFGTAFGSQHIGAPVNRAMAGFRDVVKKARGE